MEKGVLVGMSGGVDSAAAAILLQEQGYWVEGMTLLMWGEDDTAAADAAGVCGHLGIPHHVLDVRERFRANVIDAFADEYAVGRTPNPCVTCNRTVKVAAMAEEARARGIPFIATGHYARTVLDDSGRRLLQKSHNLKKDQSYVLYGLPRHMLQMLLLPLEHADKGEIRALVAGKGLDIASKADSQDICFVPDGDYAGFLESIRPGQEKLGLFVDEAGAPLGAHKGLWHYTIGQRKGLGIAFGKPVFVSGIDPASGNITLGEGESLFQSVLVADNLNWLDREALTGPERFEAKIRYSAKTAAATAAPLPDGRVRVMFDQPQRAITPGQAVVFYTGDVVSGGGRILHAGENSLS